MLNILDYELQFDKIIIYRVITHMKIEMIDILIYVNKNLFISHKLIDLLNIVLLDEILRILF